MLEPVQEVDLDRVLLDDVGSNPERLAAAIHAQLGERPGPVPVRAIARALDIEDIREEPLRGIEAALVTTPERGYGAIVVNAASSPARRRFSIGHELGHFLNPGHQPTMDVRFECTRADMALVRAQGSRQHSRHHAQEIEANRFSIELLAPRDKLRPFLVPEANLRHVLAIAAELDISREASARRYVALHRQTLAVVFSQDGSFIYVHLGPGFPPLALRRGGSMPDLRCSGDKGPLSALEKADPGVWLVRPRRQLYAQTLYQQNGYRTTLLVVEASQEDDYEEAQGLFESIDRLGSR